MKLNYPGKVYLNGNWINSKDAKVSVFDRGFLFGDGIYEVIPFYKGKAFLAKEHLDRLKYSLKEVELNCDISNFDSLILKAIEMAELNEEDGAIYIQVTRGMAPRTHSFPENYKATILMYAYKTDLSGFQNQFSDVLVSSDIRWHRCDIKSVSLMANILANTEAKKAGFAENIMIRDGFFTEGSHSSLFFVKDDIVYTHPNSPFILPGITRNLLIKLCKENNIEIVEKALPVSELNEVTEVFITGTTTQITAIKNLHFPDKDIKIGNEIGSITRKLQHLFSSEVKKQLGITIL
ncbi:aminotransferase class IV [Zunongwangia endophytica]|uniref:Aminotransferase class IV n=1 Tax=Zunongwangia endophytica TaxID=1808945 RepID=A0ABV8HBV8_9FLAO|nr:aminotransferase class IV [Zunongwangia endophytica]MDN3593421.1 aminotransferase class IV [Zunongwangia endophytica]